ncbi:MAG TPA: hypothetical protein VGH89_21375 [Pseudonocardia sp.]|jgi:hypothetical protein
MTENHAPNKPVGSQKASSPSPANGPVRVMNATAPVSSSSTTQTLK